MSSPDFDETDDDHRKIEESNILIDRVISMIFGMILGGSIAVLSLTATICK